jgi:hypothetical protein
VDIGGAQDAHYYRLVNNHDACVVDIGGAQGAHYYRLVNHDDL